MKSSPLCGANLFLDALGVVDMFWIIKEQRKFIQSPIQKLTNAPLLDIL